ncbi:GlxA family transcriptional regulator [Winogradskya humida]|uniref:Transcriptional regulator n=1 Tax=Winogradskya humida TaxID=113566 RepID=A0ABQ4A333_9ACTN|nr:helix-turn-helix domain-containing protein [Actinoplanes humidus]GIE25260.1 transcriptional regulator [Actinoplanes humidus]
MAHRIALLALNEVVGFDLSAPAQVFGAARAPDNTPFYETFTCGIGGLPIRASRGGFQILPDHDLEPLTSADTVLVPGTYAALASGTVEPVVTEALRAAHERGARIISTCTGASVLAAVGLLDGRRAASHWDWAGRLRRFWPAVEWDFDVLFVDDGDVLTSAGVGAGIDLCLHVVRSDHGSLVANQAARRCVVPPFREGGQAQYIERPIPQGGTGGTKATQSWALDRLADPVSLDEMATHARMSIRTFTRRFRDETGLSPQKWLLQQRVAHARLLLEQTDLSVDLVARRSGLGSATALRQHFQQSVGVAPSAYRRTFRGL